MKRWPTYVVMLLALGPVAVAQMNVEDVEGDVERPALYRSSRDFREIAQNPLFTDRLTFGVQLQFLTTIEDDDSDFVMDGLELALEATPFDGVEGFLSLLYEDIDHKSERVEIDEAFLRLGGTETVPFFIEAGRMELPFGEFNSSFIEGPPLDALGETSDDAVTLGFETEGFEILLSAFSGEIGSRSDLGELVAAVLVDPVEGLELGTYWISDISESDEMRKTINGEIGDSKAEAAEDPDEMVLEADEVMGWGAFLSAESERLLFDVEYITALESYRPGLLQNGRARPAAGFIELGCWLRGPWLGAVRLDLSEDLPDEPEYQYGLSSSYGVSENLIVSAEYLRGEFKHDTSNRDLILFEVTLAY